MSVGMHISMTGNYPLKACGSAFGFLASPSVKCRVYDFGGKGSTSQIIGRGGKREKLK